MMKKFISVLGFLFLFANLSFAKTFDVGVTVSPALPTTGSIHTLTVNVTYDFSQVNGCSASATTGCIKLFNVFNNASGTPVLLFTIAAPVGASTQQTVTGVSPSLTLLPGNTIITISAATPDGVQSVPVSATVPVLPPAVVSCTITAN